MNTQKIEGSTPIHSKKRSNSQENKKEREDSGSNYVITDPHQPKSATGFASTQKPNLGDNKNNNKTKPNSPRIKSHSTNQPPPKAVESINYKEIIGKIEEKDQKEKEIIKTQKSNSQRKKESNHKKTFTSKFAINDFSS